MRYCHKHPKIKKYGYNNICRACKNIALYKQRAKVKRLVFEAYGGECRKCGVSDIDVLNLDHIADDGNLRRKKFKGRCGVTGVHFYRELIRKKFPPGLQVLCANCNCKKKVLKERRERKYG